MRALKSCRPPTSKVHLLPSIGIAARLGWLITGLATETGRAVARRLKEKHVPFLYYSGRALDDFTTGSGAPVIAKPAGGREIVGMLRLLLDGKA